MVVPEALVSGCRVLMSDNVGASSISHKCAAVKSLRCSDEEWGQALIALVSLTDIEPFRFQAGKRSRGAIWMRCIAHKFGILPA